MPGRGTCWLERRARVVLGTAGAPLASARRRVHWATGSGLPRSYYYNTAPVTCACHEAYFAQGRRRRLSRAGRPPGSTHSASRHDAEEVEHALARGTDRHGGDGPAGSPHSKTPPARQPGSNALASRSASARSSLRPRLGGARRDERRRARPPRRGRRCRAPPADRGDSQRPHRAAPRPARRVAGPGRPRAPSPAAAPRRTRG